MRVIVTGGTGLIGVPLVSELAEAGHEVIVLSRSPAGKAGLFPSGVRVTTWDARSGEGWAHLINADTALVNLAGEGVANWRWTDAHRRRVLQSRIDTSQAMVDAVRQADTPPCVLLQASAVGYYGSRGDEWLDEDSSGGDGWRAEVCQQWEPVTEAVAQAGVRRCVLRIGIVLDKRGGALPPMTLGARFMGGQLGSGQQWIPWIHNADVAGAVIHLMKNESAAGVYNLTTPYPVTNRRMMQALGQVMGWPAFIPVPGFALEIALGEMASSVLDSQRVYPRRLLESGYVFRYKTIEAALS